MNRLKKDDAAKNGVTFRDDEDGSMVVMTLFLLIAMLLMGGLAVDLMRFETYRARLQSTIDRAVLAASNLDTCLGRSEADVAQVVNDYATLNGFGGQVTNIDVNQTPNSCTVTADAQLDINTIFFSWVGIDTLGTPASSGATEAIGDVEVSLVLDISGSMGGRKIGQLQTAASNFVDSMTTAIDRDRLSMSIVPYSTHVSIGPEMMAQYNTQYNHDYSHCIDLPESTYSTTAIDPSALYDQAAHFDPYSGASYNTIRPAGYAYSQTKTYFACADRPSASILPFNGDADDLKRHINNLETDNYTSIEMGANWGVALLDPSTQSITSGLVSAGVVEARYASRPQQWNANDVLKVMVLMTDGENTVDYVMSTSHRDQFSDIWFDWDSNVPYVNNETALRLDPSLRGVGQAYDPSDVDHMFYVDDRESGSRDGDRRRNERYYNVESERLNRNDRASGEVTEGDYWTNSRNGARQTWQDIWARFGVRSHAWNFRADQTDDFGAYNRWYNDLITVTYRAEKDARLRDICDAARAADIQVYTIGFELQDSEIALMAYCASTDSQFFRVAGPELDAAFSSIAAQISALRLIQ